MDSPLTIDDIAKLAGVSSATVSRVLAGKVGSRSKVKQKVLRVLQETNFQPNPAAQSLASKRTGLIGMIFPISASGMLSSTYHVRVIEAISYACNLKKDYNLVMFLCETPADEAAVFLKINRKGMFDGVIANVGADNGDRLAALVSKMAIPIVTIGRRESLPGVSFVDVNNFQAAYNVVNHLAGLGRKRIAMISSPLGSTDGVDRVAGYRKALASRGLPVEEALIVEGDNTEKLAYQRAKKLLTHSIDAIFAAGDRMALGAIRAVNEQGLSVPDDIAIIGFDDLPAAVSANPPLTTVRQPLRALGTKVVNILIEHIENPDDNTKKIFLDAELIIRKSCGIKMD
jgi:LacI family transcriptional regulator